MYIYVYMSLYLSLSLFLSLTLSLSCTHTHTQTHTHTHTHTHRKMFVVNSRHLVLERIKTPKKSYKISEIAVSDTLLISGLQIFAGDAAFQNRALRDFSYALNHKKSPIIARFLPESMMYTAFFCRIICFSAGSFVSWQDHLFNEGLDQSMQRPGSLGSGLTSI